MATCQGQGDRNLRGVRWYLDTEESTGSSGLMADVRSPIVDVDVDVDVDGDDDVDVDDPR